MGRVSKDEIIDEVLKPNQKIKATVEENVIDEETNVTNEADNPSPKTSVSSSSSNVSKIIANIWLVWSTFNNLFLSGNINDTDVNDYR